MKIFTSRSIVLIYVFFLVVLLCAQNVLGEESEEIKNGFRISKDTMLHVGLSISPEFESNITKVSENSFTTDNISGTTEKVKTIQDLILHYSPSIRIKLDDMSKTVGFSVFFDYNHYLGLQNSDTSKKLSDLDLKSDFLGQFNKNGSIFFEFDNKFSRTANPDGQELSGRHKNLLDNFVLGLGFKNLEDTLLLKIQTGVDFNYYEESKDLDSYKDFNYVSFVADIFGRWKFLPKTMIFLKASYRYQDYYESSIRSKAKSMPFNVFAGMMGQITPHISAKLSAGYSAAFSDDTKHDYNANAEFVFKYGKNTFLSAGYLRNMRPSANYLYYSTHRLYLNFKQKFARVFLAKLDFSYSFLEFGPNMEFSSSAYTYDSNTGSYEKDTETSSAGTYEYSVKVPGGLREDQLLMLNPSISYNILSWLGLKLSYELEYRKSDYFKEVTGIWTDFNNPAANNFNKTVHYEYDYIDHKVLLNITLDY